MFFAIATLIIRIFNCFLFSNFRYTNPIFKFCRTLSEVFEAEVFKLRHPDLTARKLFPFSKGGAAPTAPATRSAPTPVAVSKAVSTPRSAPPKPEGPPTKRLIKTPSSTGPARPTMHTFTPTTNDSIQRTFV